MKNIKKQVRQASDKEEISRREAMTRLGLAAFSATTMMLLLNKPGKLQAQDTSSEPDDPDTW